MSRRSRIPKPLGAFPVEIDATAVIMRSAVLMAVDEIPDAVLQRIMGRRPNADWLDYDEARRQIAKHLVVRIRAQIRCEYVSAPAIAR